MKTKILKGIILSLVFVFVACGQKESEAKKYEESKFVFGTYVKIVTYDKDEKKSEAAVKKAFDEIERIDRDYNSKNENSVIYALNNKKIKEIELNSELKYLFDEVTKMYELTNKKYDITIAPLLDLWGFTEEKIDLPNLKIPNKEEIDFTKKFVDYSKVKFENNKLFYEDGIKEIDTGSFIKGYALQRAREILEQEGIENALVTAISSLDTIGAKPNKSGWKIGLEDPSDEKKMLGIITLKGESLGVSGDYQTFIEIDGKKYHHILDVNTGFPVEDKKMVAVICQNGFQADLYSTSFFLMPIEEVLAYVEKDKDMEVLIVDKDNQIHKSSGFELDEVPKK